MVVDGIEDRERGMPTIYTAAKYLDRAEAERMLRHMMALLGHREVKFSWQKSKHIAWPVSA